MNPNDVGTAEIDQSLHRREAVVEGSDRQQQIVAALIEKTHLGTGELCANPLLVNPIEGFA
jgi:hypothetical protein